VFSTLHRLFERIRNLDAQNRKIIEALGRIESRQLASVSAGELAAAEFRVYSQWGEDGILQHLLQHVRVPRKVFVEFGVETYAESNTRFLLVNNYWSGLVMDGSQDNVCKIKNDNIYWRHDLRAVKAFITKENINDLVRSSGIIGEIGLLSIDIDGNDYWVWEAIDVVDPAIVVVEYNARFGPSRAVTIPYQPDFDRHTAPGSGIYFGASLAAFAILGNRKGYALVGTNSAGNNAFFVKRRLMPNSLPELSAQEAFVQSKFREARGPSGNLLYLDQAQEMHILEGLPLVDVSESSAVETGLSTESHSSGA
jgi:hypothetical protein